MRVEKIKMLMIPSVGKDAGDHAFSAVRGVNWHSL